MPAKKPTAVTATDIARNLSDLLNRIQYRGERFVVVRNGAEVAEISPPRRSSGTFGDYVEELRRLPPLDEGFATDVAEIRADQQPTPESSWES